MGVKLTLTFPSQEQDRVSSLKHPFGVKEIPPPISASPQNKVVLLGLERQKRATDVGQCHINPTPLSELTETKKKKVFARERGEESGIPLESPTFTKQTSYLSQAALVP